jgi:hypothetical protein
MNLPVYTPTARDISKMSRLSTFRDISRSLPMNEYGLPKFFYRADLIPEDLFLRPPEEQISLLEAATIDINYLEGFPAYDSQAAIWSQMEFEPDDAYEAFKQYLAQGQHQGIRRLESLLQNNEYLQHVPHHYRSLTKLTELHTYYYWAPRTKAADLFEQAASSKLRERRILSIQDRHYLESERLLKTLKDKYFDRIDPETGEYIWIEEMTPKVALEFLDKLVKIQRISLGLPAHGLSNPEDDGIQRHASVEVTLKQIARRATDPEAANALNGTSGFDMLLADPETAMLAQQLIVRIGSGSSSPDSTSRSINSTSRSTNKDSNE